VVITARVKQFSALKGLTKIGNVMKLEIEIEDEEMKYYYKLGACYENGNCAAHPEHYIMLVEFIKSFMKQRHSKSEDIQTEIFATMFIRDNLEKAQKLIDKFINCSNTDTEKGNE